MKKYIAIMAAFLFVFVVGLRKAEAIPTLTLDDTSTLGVDVTVTDLDADGYVIYNGAVGSFVINTTVGLTKPSIGTASAGELHLTSLDVSSSAGGTLIVRWSDTGFGIADPAGITLSAGGVTGGTVTIAGYADASDALFGQGTLIGILGPFGGAFSGSTTTGFGADQSFSMTLVATITHSGAKVTSVDVHQAVPEPATLLLIGAGLLGIGVISRKRIKT